MNLGYANLGTLERVAFGIGHKTRHRCSSGLHHEGDHGIAGSRPEGAGGGGEVERIVVVAVDKRAVALERTCIIRLRHRLVGGARIGERSHRQQSQVGTAVVERFVEYELRIVVAGTEVECAVIHQSHLLLGNEAVGSLGTVGIGHIELDSDTGDTRGVGGDVALELHSGDASLPHSHLGSGIDVERCAELVVEVQRMVRACGNLLADLDFLGSAGRHHSERECRGCVVGLHLVERGNHLAADSGNCGCRREGIVHLIGCRSTGGERLGNGQRGKGVAIGVDKPYGERLHGHAALVGYGNGVGVCVALHGLGVAYDSGGRKVVVHNLLN